MSSFSSKIVYSFLLILILGLVNVGSTPVSLYSDEDDEKNSSQNLIANDIEIDNVDSVSDPFSEEDDEKLSKILAQLGTSSDEASEESKSDEHILSELQQAATDNDVFKMLLECQKFNIKYQKPRGRVMRNAKALEDIEHVCHFVFNHFNAK